MFADQLDDITAIGNPTNLTSLDLSDCAGIMGVSAVYGLTNLSVLKLYPHKTITELSMFQKPYEPNNTKTTTTWCNTITTCSLNYIYIGVLKFVRIR